MRHSEISSDRETEFLAYMLSPAHSDEEFYAIDKKKRWMDQHKAEQERKKQLTPAA